MVTVPVLVVVPAAIVRVLLSLRAKSAAAAVSPGAAPTVMVTGAAAALPSSAVTVATPPFSAMESSSSFKLRSGASDRETVTESAVTLT